LAVAFKNVLDVVKLKFKLIEQLFASVIVTVYKPTPRLVAVAVVCVGVVFHAYVNGPAPLFTNTVIEPSVLEPDEGD
jgi:hypothetical protein